MAYEQLFAGGRPLDPRHLLRDGHLPCEWSVRMLTGPVPDMGGKLVRHRKRFWAPDSKGSAVCGVNVVRDSTCWGYHCVEVGWGRDGRPATVLDYDLPVNTFLTRSIVDHVRVTGDPDLLVGKFYLGDSFLGYFTLARLP